MAEQNATLTLPTGEVVELPVLKGSYGPDVIDVSGLLKAGFFTYDPGFMSTAATESTITYIDGGEGVLLHRGYSIEGPRRKFQLFGNLLPLVVRRTPIKCAKAGICD